MNNSPILFSELYTACSTVIGWVSDFFDVMRQPMSDWIELDLGGVGDLPIVSIIVDAVNYVLDLLLQSRFGSLTLLEFCFGSGLTTILVIAIVRLFLSIKK